MSEPTDALEAPERSGEESGPGLYGKVSKKGDFVTRRLPRTFVDPWDAWLQSAMANSRDKLGGDWLDAYLNAPIWRFALSAGICGDAVVAGVLMPSVDKVGRHFPLALAAVFDEQVLPTQVMTSGADWFAVLEDLALSTLEDDFDFDDFDKSLADSTFEGNSETTAMFFAPARALEGRNWRLAIDPSSALGPGDPMVTHQILRSFMPRYSIWWCAGAERVAPSFLACEDLPSKDSFTALLDGDWGQWNWAGTKPGAMPWAEDEAETPA